MTADNRVGLGLDANLGPANNEVPLPLHFGHFSDMPEYREVNRALVQELIAHLPNPFVHVDLATGAGLRRFFELNVFPTRNLP